MADKSWKAWERRVARLTNTQRRGADYGDASGGKDDCYNDTLSVECKLLKTIRFADVRNAVAQAERNGPDNKLRIAVLKKPRMHDKDAIVAMSLEEFRAWFVAQPAEEETGD